MPEESLALNPKIQFGLDSFAWLFFARMEEGDQSMTEIGHETRKGSIHHEKGSARPSSQKYHRGCRLMQLKVRKQRVLGPSSGVLCVTQ